MIIDGKMRVEITEYNDGKRWFSVTELSGGTCHNPYSPISLDELKELRGQIDAQINIMDGRRLKGKLYSRIVGTVDAMNRCIKAGNDEWIHNHLSQIGVYEGLLPSGSGVDSGCNIDRDSTEDKLVITSSFHFMDDNGMYDGWGDFKVVVTPSLQFGIKLKITGKFGRKYQHVKEYLYDLFQNALEQEV